MELICTSENDQELNIASTQYMWHFGCVLVLLISRSPPHWALSLSVKTEIVAVMHLTDVKHAALERHQFVESVAALIQDECEVSKSRYWRCLLTSDSTERAAEVNAGILSPLSCTYTYGQEVSRSSRRSKDEEAGREKDAEVDLLRWTLTCSFNHRGGGGVNPRVIQNNRIYKTRKHLAG